MNDLYSVENKRLILDNIIRIIPTDELPPHLLSTCLKICQEFEEYELCQKISDVIKRENRNDKINLILD